MEAHEKSTALANLASHLVSIVNFGKMIASDPERNMIGPDGKPTPPRLHTEGAGLLAAFDENVASTRNAIAALEDEALTEAWTLRAGDRVIMSLPRAVALRTLLMNHSIHHRGQLSVYLRLNEVPLPSIYGPSADTPL